MEHLQSVLVYINSVRSDAYASPEQKLADLDALEGLDLTRETAQSILSLSDTRMQAIQEEAIVVLEQVMRTTIREDRLEESRQSVSSLISLSIPEEQAGIVAEWPSDSPARRMAIAGKWRVSFPGISVCWALRCEPAVP